MLTQGVANEIISVVRGIVSKSGGKIGRNLSLHLVGRIRIRLSERKRNTARRLFCHGGESANAGKLELVERRIEGEHALPFVCGFIAIASLSISRKSVYGAFSFSILRTSKKTNGRHRNLPMTAVQP